MKIRGVIIGDIGRHLIIFGISLVAIGFVLILGQRIGLGRLPGDIFIKKGNFTFAFPIVTSIIISIILSIILNFFRR